MLIIFHNKNKGFKITQELISLIKKVAKRFKIIDDFIG
jgi:hypothetical protein